MNMEFSQKRQSVCSNEPEYKNSENFSLGVVILLKTAIFCVDLTGLRVTGLQAKGYVSGLR